MAILTSETNQLIHKNHQEIHMGALSAISSINRVIEKHGHELQAEYASQARHNVKSQLKAVELANNTYAIDVTWLFNDGTRLDGPSIDIDNLADRFPDCDVAY